MTTDQPHEEDAPFPPVSRSRAMTAGQLAERLMEHPEADVRLMVPQEFAIIGQMFFGNEDGSHDLTHPNGVFLLAINLGGFKDEKNLST